MWKSHPEKKKFAKIGNIKDNRISRSKDIRQEKSLKKGDKEDSEAWSHFRENSKSF